MHRDMADCASENFLAQTAGLLIFALPCMLLPKNMRFRLACHAERNIHWNSTPTAQNTRASSCSLRHLRESSFVSHQLHVAVLHSAWVICRLGPGWCNAQSIFPEGYMVNVKLPSSVDPAMEEHTHHFCSIIGEEGEFFPRPTFQISASDTSDPINAKSCNECCSKVCLACNIQRVRMYCKPAGLDHYWSHNGRYQEVSFHCAHHDLHRLFS